MELSTLSIESWPEELSFSSSEVITKDFEVNLILSFLPNFSKYSTQTAEPHFNSITRFADHVQTTASEKWQVVVGSDRRERIPILQVSKNYTQKRVAPTLNTYT